METSETPKDNAPGSSPPAHPPAPSSTPGKDSARQAVPTPKDSPLVKEMWRLYEVSGLKRRLDRAAADLVNKAFSHNTAPYNTTRPRNTTTHKQPAGDPYTILGVLPSDSPAMVDAVFRAKARILHPDKGGDARAFAQLKQAYDLIRKVRNRGAL